MMVMKTNSKEMLVIGAGGHAKVIVDILKLSKQNLSDIKIFDDFSSTAVLGIKVSGKIEDTKERMNMYAWLDILEFKLLELPKPDIAIFLHMPYEFTKELPKTKVGKVDFKALE